MEKTIIKIVKNVRHTLIDHVKNKRVTNLDFDNSPDLECACAFGSFVAVTVSRHLSIDDFDIITGECNNGCHVWNQYGNFYYDSTITQFGYRKYKYPIDSDIPRFTKRNKIPVTVQKLRKEGWPIEQLPIGNPDFFVRVVGEVLHKTSSKVKLDNTLVNEHLIIK